VDEGTLRMRTEGVQGRLRADSEGCHVRLRNRDREHFRGGVLRGVMVLYLDLAVENFHGECG